MHRGITQQQLAVAIGATRATVANLEAGRQRMSAYALVLAAGALEVSVADLLPIKSERDGLLRATRLPKDVPEAHRTILDRVLASAANGEDFDVATKAQHRREESGGAA
jgi:transcriptional regulator with XRE-family HTH domain